MSGYYPEMGEAQPVDKLIYSEFCYKKFSIIWDNANDAAVKALCKSNRIKLESEEIRNRADCRSTIPGESLLHFAYITVKGHDKLREAGVIATKIYLD